MSDNGEYDGTECPNCKRERVMIFADGHRHCEKCNWDPDMKEYYTPKETPHE